MLGRIRLSLAGQPLAPTASMHKVYRTETNCLNCGRQVTGKFCAECGQENIEPRQKFRHLATHFIGDYFHFDNKFLRSVWPLVFRPGQLTNEFNAGRRVRYLPPVQFYIFTSIVFFIVLGFTRTPTIKPAEKPKLTVSDTLSWEEVKAPQEPLQLQIGNDSTAIDSLPASVEIYQEQQARLPEEKRHGYLTQVILQQTIKFKADPEKFKYQAVGKVFQSFPKLMFLLLPLFALLLFVLFRKARMYYVEHVIFSLHFHTFVFIVWLFTLLFEKATGWDISGWVFLAIVVYLFIALRRVYQLTWGGTLWRFSMLFFLYTFSASIVLLAGTLLVLAMV